MQDKNVDENDENVTQAEKHWVYILRAACVVGNRYTVYCRAVKNGLSVTLHEGFITVNRKHTIVYGQLFM